MPAIGTILFLLNIFFIIHAARTGRFWPWGYVMLFLPGFGLLAYVLVELLPEWRGTPRARRAEAQLIKSVDPRRRYRALRENIENADTVANRLALAQECLDLGKFDEAQSLYDSIIRTPQGDDPMFYLGRARAEFGLDEPQQALATLDEVTAQWPNHRSQETQLLHARVLDRLGRDDEALAEYVELARSYAGAEPRVRQMQLLDRMGRKDEAQAIAQDVVSSLKRAPAFARKQQEAWYSAAKSYLRG